MSKSPPAQAGGFPNAESRLVDTRLRAAELLFAPTARWERDFRIRE